MVQTIDLSGPDGNAYALLAYAESIGRQLGFSNEKIKEIKQDMKSSNYEHLLSVFRKHFNGVVELVR